MLPGRMPLCGGDGTPAWTGMSRAACSPRPKALLSHVTDTLRATPGPGMTGGRRSAPSLSASITGAHAPRFQSLFVPWSLPGSRMHDPTCSAACRASEPVARVHRRPDASWRWRTRGRVLEKFRMCSSALLGKPECASAACWLLAGDTPLRNST